MLYMKNKSIDFVKALFSIIFGGLPWFRLSLSTEFISHSLVFFSHNKSVNRLSTFYYGLSKPVQSTTSLHVPL